MKYRILMAGYSILSMYLLRAFVVWDIKWGLEIGTWQDDSRYWLLIGSGISILLGQVGFCLCRDIKEGKLG